MHDSVTYKIVLGNVMSGDTESENEIYTAKPNPNFQFVQTKGGERDI